ncbi:DUF4870 domain-containing protein [Ornithinimicrobium sp. W1679]|uniref:DUF4870 domain-containing protein n=1 Tax=Ornithinimicrobium sp. W1679 TaxID=3418770 RepID=UPI003CFB8A7E
MSTAPPPPPIPGDRPSEPQQRQDLSGGDQPHVPGPAQGQGTDPWRSGGAPDSRGGWSGQGVGPSGQGRTPVEGEERTMMLLAHLSAPISFLLSGAWLPFLGPLLVWVFYKDRSQAVRVASAGAFNFNVSMTIATVALWLSVILTLGIGFLWAIPLWIILFVVQIWAHVKGAMMASRGEVFEYPFQIRILN